MRFWSPPPQTKISKAALETLAIIAYKQPIIRSEVEHIRGVDSGGVLRILLEKNLIKILGRKEIPGRPLIYVTTKHFLEVFDLKDLKSLPTPKQIEAFQKPSSGDKQIKDEQKQMELPGMKGSPSEKKWKVFAEKHEFAPPPLFNTDLPISLETEKNPEKNQKETQDSY